MADWLILHGGALGDLALTLHLALRLPGVESASTLAVVSRVDPGDLSACRPSIRRIPPEGIGLHWLHADGDDPPPERLRELISGRRVLNALGDIDSTVHRRLLSLGARAVFSFDPRPDLDAAVHITAQWQSLLEAQGLLIPKCDHQHRDGPRLFVPEELREHGRASRPWHPILIHPGSGGRTKCWPLSCFIGVARRLRESGEDVCFTVGPVEAERWSSDELGAIRGEFPLIQSPSPNGLLGLLAGARVLISNDAGPAQLAALLGTPTVTIFGPTFPTVWRPLGPNARHLRGNPESSPEDWGIDPARVAASATSAPA